MKKIIILIFVITTLSASSQTLKVIRTDVDTLRAGFVTSTYLFTYELVIDSIRSCYGVAVEIKFDQSSFVSLSGARFAEIWDKSSSMIISKYDTVSKTGNIVIGVLTNVIQNTDTSKPLKIGSFDFVVNQMAYTNPASPQSVNFTFPTAQAFFIDSGKQKYVDLQQSDVSYVIHGFSDVWPGDANYDGIVDVRDITNIGLYLNFAANHNLSRTFKRESGSTIWSAQRVLTWDSLAVTYSDCDGDGEVNINDLLIVPLNYNKKKSGIKNENISPVLTYLDDSYYHIEKGFSSLPLKINSDERIVAIAGELTSNANIYGIMPSKIDLGYYSYLNKTNEGKYIFTIGNFNQEAISGCFSNIPGFFITDENHSLSVNFSQLKGLTDDGRIIPLDSYTDIKEEKSKDLVVNYLQGVISINIKNDVSLPTNIKLFDIKGSDISASEFNINSLNNSTRIDVRNLRTGTYIIRFQSGSDYYSYPFVINN